MTREPSEIPELPLLESIIVNFEDMFLNCKEMMNLFSVTRRQVLAINPVVKQFLGYSLADFQETPIDRFYPPEEMTKLIDSWQKLVADGCTQSRAKMYTKSGELRDLVARSVIVQRQPEIVAIVHTLDVTEKAMEAPISQQEKKLAALGEMVTIFAHELTNAVSSVHACLSLIELDSESGFSEKAKQRFRRAKLSTDLIGNIIRSIQKYNRSSEEKAFINLATIIGRVQRLLSTYLHAQDVQVFTKFNGDIPLVWAKANEVEQIILILIKSLANALEKAQRRALTLEVMPINGCARLSIADAEGELDRFTGEKIAALFDSPRALGSEAGLGLETAKRLALANHIKLTFKVDPGSGSCFELLF